MGLIFYTSYYSELWLINRGNLTDKLWYDTYDRNTTMEDYGKLNGLNFNLEELEESFFDKFTGIQRTEQIYYFKSFQLFCLLIIFKAGNNMVRILEINKT